MQIIYQQSFTDFNYATAAMFEAALAINTKSLPDGKTLSDFAADFLKKSLERRFSEGFNKIHSSFYLSEDEFTYSYESTSGTEVFLTGGFDNTMQPCQVVLTILLPDERLEPGRQSYEALTKKFYRHQFSTRGDDDKFAIVPVVVADRPLPTPEWALEEVFDLNLTDDEIKKELLAMGFRELTQLLPIWQQKFWLHSEMMMNAIYRRERGLPRFSLSTIADDSINFDWRLPELIKKTERFRSRSAIESTLDCEYEEYFETGSPTTIKG